MRYLEQKTNIFLFEFAPKTFITFEYVLRVNLFNSKHYVLARSFLFSPFFVVALRISDFVKILNILPYYSLCERSQLIFMHIHNSISRFKHQTLISRFETLYNTIKQQKNAFSSKQQSRLIFAPGFFVYITHTHNGCLLVERCGSMMQEFQIFFLSTRVETDVVYVICLKHGGFAVSGWNPVLIDGFIASVQLPVVKVEF